MGKGEGTRRQSRSCVRKNSMKPGGSLISQHSSCILSSLEALRFDGQTGSDQATQGTTRCQRPAQESSNPCKMQGNSQQPIQSTKQAGLMSEQEVG